MRLAPAAAWLSCVLDRLQLAEKIKSLGRAAMVPELNDLGRLLWQRTLAKELDLDAFLAIQVYM